MIYNNVLFRNFKGTLFKILKFRFYSTMAYMKIKDKWSRLNSRKNEVCEYM
jgi:hypothetical protein